MARHLGLLMSLLAVPSGLAAQGWGATVAIASDYVYRGVSQNLRQPLAQAGIHFQSGAGFSAGAWGSRVEFDRRTDSAYELDLHATYAYSFEPDWWLQLGLVHYQYPSRARVRSDYDELTATLNYQQRVSLRVAWSPNTSGYVHGYRTRADHAAAYELAMLQPLAGVWALSAGLGHYDLREVFEASYWYWNVGLVLSWRTLQLDLQHMGADSTAQQLFGSRLAGSHWATVLTLRF